MKKKLLIATHSVFADGIKNAMELVTGEQNSVSTLCAYTNDMTEVETPIKEIIDALCDDEELIVTTDIFGGSVNNEFMKYLSKSNIHLIAAARDLTVQNIGKTGHGKHDAGDDLHPAPDLTEVHTDQKNRDHHDTKQRDLRCSRHYAFSSISPTRSPSSAPVMRTITNSPGETLRAAENSTRPSISGESA